VRAHFERGPGRWLPAWLRPAARLAHAALGHAFLGLRDLARLGRRERFINLWVTRLDGADHPPGLRATTK
jgi:hypothetical protein